VRESRIIAKLTARPVAAAVKLSATTVQRGVSRGQKCGASGAEEVQCGKHEAL
jgi:hypothetical protein